MDELSARAQLADSAVESGLRVSVPRNEVERALQADAEADLLLDVVRQTNGEREERRVSLAWDRDALERLARQEGDERVTIAIDPASLQAAFDEVEAHGLREVGATLAIVVAAAGGGAGSAAAADSQFQPFVTDFPSVEATVDASDYGMPRAMPSDYAQGEAASAGMPRAMPSDYAQGEAASAGMPRAMPSDYAQSAPDPAAAIENVRAERTAPGTGGEGGVSISAPSPVEAAGLAGGVALTIAAAAFALRRKREPGIA